METSASIYELRITPGIGFITGPQGQRAEQDAMRLDSSQARRVVVSLVGRERQGKTSLRRLLSGEPFDPHEPSTVGLERDLVDTQALDPGSSEWSEWRPLELRAANQSEFAEMLGRQIRERLERQRHRIPPARRIVNSVLTMTKIAVITYVALLFFFNAASSPALSNLPVFGLTVVGTCLASGLVFGARDGFGIAVGIYHFVVLCESMIRWRTSDWFEDVVEENGVVPTFALGVLWYFSMEAMVAAVLGMSLGLGLECVFCASRQPQTDYFLHGSPFLLPQLHTLVVSSLLGLGCTQYRCSRLVIVPVAGVALATLPPFLSYVFLCGIATGVSHGVFLGCGQSILFPRLNHVIKQVTSSLSGRHMIRHCLGLLPGFLITWLFGWSLVTAPSSLALFHLAVAIALVAVNELLVPSGKPSRPASTTTSAGKTNCPASWQARPAGASSSIGVQQPSSVLTSEWTRPTPRIVVRDFAGHPLYYSAHHVYMAGQCIYVLVFSLVEANRDFDHVLRHVISWLQSIYLHTGFPDTRVMLVGTHRDDPELARAGMDLVGAIGHRLRKELPRHFHNMLVWTDNDTPLFPVENSIRDKYDPDHRYLRSRLLQTVNELNTDKHPLRYFYFFHLLEERRARGLVLEQSDVLLAQCKVNQCAIKDQDDFDAMLLLFQRLGEVLYFPDNNLLQSIVVLSPHAVLDLLSKLLDVPRMADRPQGLVTAWSRLQTTGVCSRALFDHVLHKHAKELQTHSDTVLYLLQTLNLICPLGMRGAEAVLVRHRSRELEGGKERLGIREPCEHNEEQEECYLVPAALPDKLAYPHHYWETTPSDWELLMDGLPVLPHPAFQRLLSVCAAQDVCDAQDELGGSVLTACKSRAAFTFGRSRCYKLELVSSKVTTSYHGRLLKLVVASTASGSREASGNSGREVVTSQAVVRFVWQSLVKIVRRDFRRCHLRIGVSCPCATPHQNVQQAQDRFHFLTLCDTRDKGNQDFVVPQEQEFWCCGRRVLYSRGKVYECTSQGVTRATAVRPRLPILELPLSDIPQVLHAQICDLLDVPHALGNDWSALAGELGMTARQVELLRHRAPRDPCDALLQDWASRAPTATLRDLAAIMLHIQRMDVVKTIEDFTL